MDRPSHRASRQKRKRRYTATPSRVEVNVRAIRLLAPHGWTLWDIDQFPIVGTVPKNYLSYGNPHKLGNLGYIAKKGRTSNDARECVTEEIISKIGAMLPLEIAKSKLVRLSKTDVRFLSRSFVVRDAHELLHGIELVARYFKTNRAEVESAFNLKDRKAEQSLYTVTNILTILESLYPGDFITLKQGFFKMIAFDAFVGAPDRHAMNWGVLAPLAGRSGSVRYAPIFDTARGLFREISDGDLLKHEERQGREQFLLRYANGSRPILSTREDVRQNHFDLVKWIVENSEVQDREAMRTVFDAVKICEIEHMIQRDFRRIITQFRIGFVRDLLSLRIRTIRKVLSQ